MISEPTGISLRKQNSSYTAFQGRDLQTSRPTRQRIHYGLHREETLLEGESREDRGGEYYWNEVPRLFLLHHARGVPIDRPFQDVRQATEETERCYHAEQWDGVSKPQGKDAPDYTRMDRVLSTGRYAATTERD